MVLLWRHYNTAAIQTEKTRALISVEAVWPSMLWDIWVGIWGSFAFGKAGSLQSTMTVTMTTTKITAGWPTKAAPLSAARPKMQKGDNCRIKVAADLALFYHRHPGSHLTSCVESRSQQILLCFTIDTQEVTWLHVVTNIRFCFVFLIWWPFSVAWENLKLQLSSSFTRKISWKVWQIWFCSEQVWGAALIRFGLYSPPVRQMKARVLGAEL